MAERLSVGFDGGQTEDSVTPISGRRLLSNTGVRCVDEKEL